MAVRVAGSLGGERNVQFVHLAVVPYAGLVGLGAARVAFASQHEGHGGARRTTAALGFVRCDCYVIRSVRHDA